MIDRGWLCILFFLLACLLPVLAQNPDEWQVVDTERFTILRQMDCADSNHCMIIGYMQSGVTYMRATSDGGNSWRTLYSDDGGFSALPAQLKYISYPTPDLCVAVGDSGYVLRTTDAGATWSRTQFPAKATISAIDMYDGRIGVLSMVPQSIYRTTDGGASWVPLPRPDSLLPDSLRGLVVTDIDAPTPTSIVVNLSKLPRQTSLRSDDGGATWRIQAAPWISGQFTFIDSLYAWSCTSLPLGQGGGNARDIIHRTTDGGQTWIKQVDSVTWPPFGVHGISFRDRLNGIAVGNGGKIRRSSDGGFTWAADTHRLHDTQPQQFHTVVFVSPTRAFLAATLGYILRWTPLPSDVPALPEPPAAMLHLGTNYPNPFPSRTRIPYRILSPGMISLILYDLTGHEVIRLAEGFSEPGSYLLECDGTALPAGTYTCILRHNGNAQSIQMIVAR